LKKKEHLILTTRRKGEIFLWVGGLSGGRHQKNVVTSSFESISSLDMPKRKDTRVVGTSAERKRKTLGVRGKRELGLERTPISAVPACRIVNSGIPMRSCERKTGRKEEEGKTGGRSHVKSKNARRGGSRSQKKRTGLGTDSHWIVGNKIHHTEGSYLVETALRGGKIYERELWSRLTGEKESQGGKWEGSINHSSWVRSACSRLFRGGNSSENKTSVRTGNLARVEKGGGPWRRENRYF